jgi:2-keto-4-pentenoate hydratase/2-oxohepta-3-ene-1,7-dioic acid hydratase in catechol pathway
MRLVRYLYGDTVHPGALVDGDAAVVSLAEVAPTVEALIEGGPRVLEDAVKAAGTSSRLSAGAVRLLAPLRPASLRDFLAFEDHAKAGAARRGEELNPAWYEMPVYYKGNHRQILGPDEALRWPSWTQKLDFELEVACIVGAHGVALNDEAADAVIFGYTVMNDWSARDVQRAEMAMRLGPAKSKDFATSLGPCIVTPDEFDPSAGMHLRAIVNDEVWFETHDARMHWSFAQMIAYVSSSEDVFPCDVYGSGTSFGGCGLDQDRWLQSGDHVALEVQGIGRLATRLI